MENIVPTQSAINEDLLSFVWRNRIFDQQNLRTTDGLPLQILHPGTLNTHAGPDFQNARIRLGDTLWAGNVEIHVRSSDWDLHGHSGDAAYDNVILHVVYDDDQLIRQRNGSILPCLSLRHLLASGLEDQYRRFRFAPGWLPCQERLHETPGILRTQWLERLLVERLEKHVEAVGELLASNHNDWELTCYQRVAYAYGLKINAQPFLTLSRSLPLSLLERHAHQQMQVEALVFGQAGFLDGHFTDEYPRQLAREYRFLRHKYQLEPMEQRQWKFLRLRPAAFPSLRLAQFAALVGHQKHLFRQLMDAPDLKYLEDLFNYPVNHYWLNHYLFDRPSQPAPKLPGKDLLHTLVINAVTPLLFLYGKTTREHRYTEKALHLLEVLPPESNAILNQWKSAGIRPANAGHSQALIHLRQQYCDQRRCLDCAIGNHLLRKT